MPNKNVLPETTIISSIKPSLSVLSRDVLHQKYVVEGLGTGKIAKQFASSKNRIRAALIEFGIPLDPKRHNFNLTNVPYGKKFTDDGRLVDCPKEQKIIKLILKLKADGLSNRKVSAELERRKIRTKTGKDTWHPESLRQIIKKIQST